VTDLTERMPYVASAADTFIYCVSVTGVTGARKGLPDDLKEFIARIRAKVSCLALTTCSVLPVTLVTSGIVCVKLLVALTL
jgi:tryptophan synthase alpha subunit